ncbi:MAG TPA: CRISPR-associated endonuclease Cas2 [Thermoanaerobaculia bacterium]|jgi:CRISPR-associated protein Cas2|nr:CRISPR-associated endonuclease Cas2 [Thermoanaerobaculia bacterium]
MLIVVSYDVVDDRRRTRLAHALKDFGQRVQYSVFECLLDAEALEKLRKRVEKLIDPQEDGVRLYRLCRECQSQLTIVGIGKPPSDPDVYVL